jgi:HD superfamily phosphohydrolase
MNKSVTFADVAQPAVVFSKSIPHEALCLELIDTKWFQRLRDISQTANTRLVYMFSEHSRFGHSVGVAYLAKLLLDSLSSKNTKEIAPLRLAVAAAALLHDIGHLAPGSHTAYKTWFPDSIDAHEEVGCRIILEDPEINEILNRYNKGLPELVAQVMRCDKNIPPWSWEVISGGGWNVDRGNWCIVDSVLAGVDYGRYNVSALLDAFEITNDKHLAISENRLDAMMHFAISRHAMYRQIYQHRVLMAADTINQSIVQRARDINSGPEFSDQLMAKVLKANSPEDLELHDLFSMREAWWRYHLYQWENDSDPTLSDLSKRILYRKLFKTVRVNTNENSEILLNSAKLAVEKAGYDPRYYLHTFRTANMHRGDSKQALLVISDDQTLKPLGEAEPLFEELVRETEAPTREWIALPEEAKEILGRDR